MALNTVQTAALNAIIRGENIFLTGAGGTGKSHTIQKIVDWASARGIKYGVTALTGTAALLLGLGAKTIHSWAGVGIAREEAHKLVEVVRRNKRACDRWINTELLIIDEVSMMTPDFLEKLDLIARCIRKRPETKFGGLQIVFSGDFCQLPPITKNVDSSGGPTFIFEIPLWNRLIDTTVELTEILRQHDPLFQRLLNEARMGSLSPASVGMLEQRMGLDWQENDITPTLLFAKNEEVDRVNRQNMDLLTGPIHTYEVASYTTGTITKRNTSYMTRERFNVVSPDDPDLHIAMEKLDNDAPYEKTLELREDAQVMLLFNMDTEIGLVNGSRGRVTGFSEDGSPMVKFMCLPHPILVGPNKWELPDYKGAGREQIPLKVAYAITIHKSQGVSLDTALVDIGSSTFEYGQAYVALSRVRTLTGLYVWKLDPNKIRAHPKVVEFYAQLHRAQNAVSGASGASGASGSSDAPDAPDVPDASDDVPDERVTDTKSITITAEEMAEETAEEDEKPDEDPAEENDVKRIVLLTPSTTTPFWTTDSLGPVWSPIVLSFLSSPVGRRIAEQLLALKHSGAFIQPAPQDVFAALRACPTGAVRVVILGQDPYPTAGVPHGLAFSVKTPKLQPSLKNIFIELGMDLGVEPPTNGCLTRWAEQGVLLLNDVLTVTVGAPQSHSGLGWEGLTARILMEVLTINPHVVVLAWGRFAQKKLDTSTISALIRRKGHTVLRSAHPSPLSAKSGFFGTRPFSRANDALVAHGQAPIQWL